MRYTLRHDPWTLAYALIGLAALALSSVATYVFFHYLLPWQLAVAATIVLAAGLPVLKWAIRFEPRPRYRAVLIIALGCFLLIELLAQYFKGQAAFAPAVRAAGVAGSDLALAADNPVASRLLSFAFLASLPFVVLLMVDRIADRALVLGRVRLRARCRVQRRRRVTRQLRSRVAAAQQATAAARDEAAALTQQLAAAQQTAAALTQQLAAAQQECAAAQQATAAACEELAALTATTTTLRRERDDARRLAVETRQALDAERSRPVLTLENAIGLLVAAGAPESTLRSWREAGRLRADNLITQEDAHVEAR